MQHGFTPLHLLCNNKVARAKGVGKEMVKMALEMGGEPAMPARDGCTPLHLALYHRDYEVAEVLMTGGGCLTIPWKFPQRSGKLTRWWDAEGDGTRDVLPFDMVEGDQRVEEHGNGGYRNTNLR